MLFFRYVFFFVPFRFFFASFFSRALIYIINKYPFPFVSIPGRMYIYILYYYVYTRRISLRVINSSDHARTGGWGGWGGGFQSQGMMLLGLVGGVSRVCRRVCCYFFFSLLRGLGRKGSDAAATADTTRGFLVFPNRSQNNMRKYTIICVRVCI